jgi:acyl carrier protein
MATEEQSIHDRVKKFILDQFLPGEDPNALTEGTQLITTGILDSLATLKLITYLEEEFNISVAAHEVDAENLNTIADIARFVSSKRG